MKKSFYLFFVLQFFWFGKIEAQIAEIDLFNRQYSNVQVSSNDVVNFSVNSFQNSDFKGFIQLEIIDNNNNIKSIQKTGLVPIQPGITSSAKLLSQSKLQTTFSQVGFEHAHTPQFYYPYGEYNICISLFNQENGEIDKKCLTISVENIFELLLIYPFNAESIQSPTPTFTWTPLINQNGNLSYAIKWVESENSKIDFTSFRNEVPFWVANFVRNNIYAYNIADPKFSRSKFYFWQVEAFKGNKKVAESEIWQFHYDQNKIRSSQNIWYVDVDNYDSKDTYYFRGDQIGIKLRNFNKENKLSFRIKDGRGATIMDQKSMSLAALEDGINYYIIDIKGKINTNMPHQLEVFGNRKKQVINLIKTN